MELLEPSWIGQVLLSWLVGAVSLKVMAIVMPGVRITSFGVAMKAAAILALVNFLFGGTLRFISFPLTILTFGFFLFVIDAVLLMLTAWLVKGFEISGFFVAIFAALIYSLVHLVINHLVFDTPLPQYGGKDQNLKAWATPRVEWVAT
jgi:putative membrane protein